MKKYQSWLRKTIQAKKLKVIFRLNPVTLLFQFFFQNCEGTRDSNLITIVTNIEKPDISSNLTLDISNSIDFRIDDSSSVNNDRKVDITSSDNIDNNSNIEFCQHPLNAYRCSANETVLVNTSFENKFISIAPGENVMPESLISYWKI